jgi:hypothetical protein
MTVSRRHHLSGFVAVFVCQVVCLAGNASGGLIGSFSANSTYRLIYGSTPITESGPLLDYLSPPGNVATKQIGNLAAIGFWDNPYFYNYNDLEIEHSNFFFQQSSELQIVGSGPTFDASTDGALSLEIRTVVNFFLNESAAIVYASNRPSGDAWGGVTTTVLGTNAFNEVQEAWFRLAIENQTPLAAGNYSITFISTVFTDSGYVAIGPSVVALSKYDLQLEFASASVPEPASCFVAGVLLGSFVIGNRLRRRPNGCQKLAS